MSVANLPACTRSGGPRMLAQILSINYNSNVRGRSVSVGEAVRLLGGEGTAPSAAPANAPSHMSFCHLRARARPSPSWALPTDGANNSIHNREKRVATRPLSTAGPLNTRAQDFGSDCADSDEVRWPLVGQGLTGRLLTYDVLLISTGAPNTSAATPS